jgi:type 1 glutamine amidotransferase
MAAEKKIVLVAGGPSHGPGEHEYRADALLFQKCLSTVPGISVMTYSNGWPKDPAAFEGAAAIVFLSDGGPGHPALQKGRVEQLLAAHKRGIGMGCIHWAVEPTKENGEAEFLDWIGGCFETNWSVNPNWEADFKTLPRHPITRGVKPFKISDEWYYHMRFAESMKGITPILTATPTAETLTRPDGPHSGNPDVRKAVAAGEPQVVAWAYQSAVGARGFGFTGGHAHRNWGNDDMRKIVLNSILWIAKADVPANGVESVVTETDLTQNLDAKGARRESKPTAPSTAK